jgi:mutator protein MutT
MKRILKTWRKFLIEEKGKKFKAAMAVVLNDKGEALILKRSAGPHWMPGKWALPGGHIEKGETSAEAARRETKEETNLNLNDMNELDEREQVKLYYTDSFSGDVEIDFEHTDWAWVSYEELDSYDVTPNLKGDIKLALEKKNQESENEV